VFVVYASVRVCGDSDARRSSFLVTTDEEPEVYLHPHLQYWRVCYLMEVVV